MKTFLHGLGFVLATVLGSCSGGPSQAAGDPHPQPVFHLEFPSDGIPLNEHFSFLVRVEGRQPDDLRVDADMPSHGHGMLTLPTTRRVNGGYQVDGMLLHMPGEWVIFVDYELDTQSHRQEFPLTLDF